VSISTRLVLCLLAWLFAAGQAEAGKMSVKSLRCECRTDPQGIDVRQPRLGWNIEADGRAQAQSAYEVLVSNSRPGLAADRGDLW
jgi:alpha-L-rhamnosidase